jgi:uncharacterized membrane protein
MGNNLTKNRGTTIVLLILVFASLIVGFVLLNTGSPGWMVLLSFGLSVLFFIILVLVLLPEISTLYNSITGIKRLL